MRAISLVAVLLSVVLPIGSGHAQPAKPGVEKLYILNCGEGVAGDISRWSPGVNEGKSMDFVDNCYLIKHGDGWFLWDTGISDAVATMPEVVSCHLVSGAADFLLEVVVPDLRAYERLLLDKLLSLPGVQDVRSNFAIRTVKAPGPLPLGHLQP